MWKIRPGLEPWKRWKVQRLTPSSHHVYDYNRKKLPKLRPSVKSWHKSFVLLGRYYVSISIMEQAPGALSYRMPHYISQVIGIFTFWLHEEYDYPYSSPDLSRAAQYGKTTDKYRLEKRVYFKTTGKHGRSY